MERMDVTPELREATLDAVKARRRALWTWEDITKAGGPSDGTMKRFMNGSIERIDETTLVKLGDTFGWPDGVEFDLVSPDEDTRRVGLTKAIVGPPRKSPAHGRTTRRGEELTVGERQAMREGLTQIEAAVLALSAAVVTMQAALAPDNERKP